MITGFRWGLQGAQTYFDLEPDLSTFGKGMANGFSVAVVAGRREVMSVGAINQPGMERTFLLSSTHGGEMSSLGAFLETLKIYKEEDVCGHLWAYGKRLKDGMNAVSRSLGIGEYFYLDGPPVSLTYVTKNKHGDPCQKFRTLFAQEMVKNKVLMPWVAISQSHGEVELDQTLSAVEKSLKTYSIALIDGVEKFLIGSEIKPVFRKYN
jgi:glutamate-1-semialdehyde 2,1-aminomutase